MRTMKLPLRFAPVLLAVICCASLYGFAQTLKFPPYKGHVNDFANVVDDSAEQRLETILTNFEKLTGTQIAVVTVLSLEGRPVEEYANGLYRAWGIGGKSGPNKDKGAMLLLAPNDRRTRLEVGYQLEGDLPDGLAGEIIRRMRPALQNSNFTEGMNIGVQTLVATLAEKWNVSLESIDRRNAYRGAQEDVVEISPRTLIILLLIFLFFMFILSRIARSSSGRGRRGGGGWHSGPLIFGGGGGGFGGGDWGGGSWGSGGGGGWGSSGGGSDWGGFGGGSSGGGGASDSW